MKRIFSACIVFCFFCFLPVQAQLDFEKFKQAQIQQFDDFRQQKQLEFADFLEQKWAEFEVMSGKKRVEMPKPVDPPVVDPERKKKTPPVEIPAAPEVMTIPQNLPKLPELPVPKAPKDVTYTKTTVDFLGYKLNFNYDKRFNVELKGLYEEDIAKLWRTLAKASFEEVTYQCLLIKRELKLNDWGYYMFVKNLADRIYTPDKANEKTIFTAFILNDSGYRTRIARDKTYREILLLLPIEDQVYERRYVQVDGKNYYLMGNEQKSVYSYSNNWKDDNEKRTVSLTIEEPINVSKPTETETVKNEVFGEGIRITFNPNTKDFYAQMPSCDISVPFNSECSADVTASLQTQIGKRLEGKTPYEQVATLLNFMHQGFPYKTDFEQFGKEKFFFYEEAFEYPFTDCEDNAILFAYLVRKLTGLKVIGLIYSGHAATAVNLGDNVDGAFVTFKGAKYTVCDPTYIGASVGDCIPEYMNESPTVIEIKN
ncbi:MAG: hypothetical protein LBD45_09315 [Bacteroidales bacterium]|jgi:hypothetical protein|nr:hypothetical protein [Bacteroidales bacterium]